MTWIDRNLVLAEDAPDDPVGSSKPPLASVDVRSTRGVRGLFTDGKLEVVEGQVVNRNFVLDKLDPKEDLSTCSNCTLIWPHAVLAAAHFTCRCGYTLLGDLGDEATAFSDELYSVVCDVVVQRRLVDHPDPRFRAASNAVDLNRIGMGSDDDDLYRAIEEFLGQCYDDASRAVHEAVTITPDIEAPMRAQGWKDGDGGWWAPVWNLGHDSEPADDPEMMEILRAEHAARGGAP